MKCKVCPNEEMAYRQMDISLWLKGEFIVVEKVWGYECEQCGERVFDEKTVEKILKVVQKKPATKYAKTPVFSL
jgi:YgiT-type zinc finger domain-containing protein